MLDVALTFLVNSLNEYLKARTGSALGKATLGKVVDDTGKWAVTLDQLGVALVNIEEDRVLKEQLPETSFINGKLVSLPPPLRVNLHILVCANFQKYDEGLKFLSYVLTFFQARPKFTQVDCPNLDPRIDKLTVELLSLTYEQLNQVWAFIGGKQLPSAMYRVRLVVLQDQQADVGVPVTAINMEVHG